MNCDAQPPDDLLKPVYLTPSRILHISALSGQCYYESGTHAGLTLHGYGTTSIFYNTPDGVEPDADAFDVVMQPLKPAEEVGLLCTAQAQAVVLHLQDGGGVSLVAPHPHNGPTVWMAVLDTVAK
jgi:hypothetical protein